MLISLIVAVLLDVVLLFYCRYLITSLNDLAQTLQDMSTIFGGFKSHVEMLHETEMFYGDESLQNLIEHSRFVLDKIDENSDIIQIFELEEGEVNVDNPEEEEA